MSAAPASDRQRHALLRGLAGLPTNVWLVGQEGVEKQRADRYTPASVTGHPGKLLPALARQLIDHYTKPGNWILDPLSGIGTVGVEAVYRGRNYVGIEIEPQFVRWQEENLQQAREAGASGDGTVIEEDARRLGSNALSSLAFHRPASKQTGPIDAVLTSPPYGDRLREQKNPSRKLRELIREGRFGRSVLPGVYGREPGNLGNLSNQAYLCEMRRVYRGCYEVLKPGGILAVVLQPERTRRELLPLHHETARLLTDLGFTFLDEIVAVQSRLTLDPEGRVEQVSHASFWRRLTCAQLREACLPVTLGQVEYVLVFQKPSPATPETAVRAGTHKRPPKPQDSLSAVLAGPPAPEP